MADAEYGSISSAPSRVANLPPSNAMPLATALLEIWKNAWVRSYWARGAMDAVDPTPGMAGLTVLPLDTSVRPLAWM